MNNQISIESNIDEPLIVHLGGEDTVDAILLTETINTFIKLVEKSRNEIAPDLGVQLKVKALKQGSFQIDFSAIFKAMSTEEFSNFVTTATFIIGGVKGVFEFVKFLKGKNPKSVKESENLVEVVNSEDQKTTINITTYNISANQLAVNDVNKLFEKLENDSTRDSVTIKTKSEELYINKEDFKTLSKPIELTPLEIKDKLVTRNNVYLDIKKVDYSGKSQWEFYFTGTIRAKIEDEDFLTKVVAGKLSFNSKDRLYVKIRLEQDLGDDKRIIPGSERYYIEKVIKKIDLVEQSVMPGIDEL